MLAVPTKRHMRGWTTFFSVTGVIGFVFIVVFIIVVSVLVNRYQRFIKAVRYAVSNEKAGCRFQVDAQCTLLPVFEKATTAYKANIIQKAIETTSSFEKNANELGLWCADSIARMELLMYAKNGRTNIEIPQDFNYTFIHNSSDKITIEYDPTYFDSSSTRLANNFFHYNGKQIGYAHAATVTNNANDVVKILFITFRGTATEEEWRTDFQFQQINMQMSTESGKNQRVSLFHQKIVDSRLIGENESYSFDVHMGFLSVYRSIEVSLNTVLQQFSDEAEKNTQDKKHIVVFLGHSLGGAIATVSSLMQSLKLTSDTNIDYFGFVTFGSPRSLSLLESPAYQKYVDNNEKFFGHRHVNTTDIICSLPLAVMPNTSSPKNPYMYQHLHSQINKKFQEIFFSANNKSLSYNHLLFQYVNYMLSKNPKTAQQN